MGAKFAEAFRLLGRHLGLFTAIILTVWLPGNLFVDWVSSLADQSGTTSILASVKLTMWIEAIFGPIYIGALVYALFQIKSGRSVTYGEAMAVGFRNWGSLFAARFVAGLLMGLGFIALVVPGLMLAVRYSLLDSVVILEKPGMTSARARSTMLTAGRRWQIFGAAVVFFILFILFSWLVYLPLGLVESLDILPVNVALDCLLDLAYAVIQIVMFLFYWECTSYQRLGGAEAPPAGDAGPAPGNPPVIAPPAVS